MKKLWFAGLLIGCLMAGYGYAKDSQDQKISQDAHQLKKDYQAKVDKELRGVGRQIKHLERKAEKADVKLKVDLDRTIKDLKAHKAGLDKQLIALKKSTDTGWKDIQKGVDAGLDDLKKSVEDATNRFKDKN